MVAAVAVSFLLLVFVKPAVGNGFLGTLQHPRAGQRSISKSSVEEALFFELDDLANSKHISEIEEELRPMYGALPKNDVGKLEASVTRYALHRYFARKYGWYVVGLEPAGGAWNSSSPDGVVKDRVPAYIQALFEQRLHGQGFGLRELAAFVATLLDLVQKESLENLQAVYAQHGLAQTPALTKTSLTSVVQAYIVLYIRGLNAGLDGPLDFQQMEEELREEFVIWDDVSLWAHDFHESVAFAQSHKKPFAESRGEFDTVAVFAQQLGQHYGTWQNLECEGLKSQLVEMEYKGTGRVRLSEYYKGWNDPDWHFTESAEYLRTLGALDESDPSNPSVIIPNWLTSRTNCVTPSDFYLVCCLNECEGLLASLERSIEGPVAEPARLAQAVSALPSDTVDAPRSLPQAQLDRLQAIAGIHEGVVPLHGRLFAQWMHHAYPRECPYPHTAGTTNPISPEDWIKINGDTEASTDELMRHAARRTDLEDMKVHMTPEAKVEALPWDTVEELLVSPKQRRRGPAIRALHIGLLFIFAVSALQGIRATSTSTESKSNVLCV